MDIQFLKSTAPIFRYTGFKKCKMENTFYMKSYDTKLFFNYKNFGIVWFHVKCIFDYTGFKKCKMENTFYMKSYDTKLFQTVKTLVSYDFM